MCQTHIADTRHRRQHRGHSVCAEYSLSQPRLRGSCRKLRVSRAGGWKTATSLSGKLRLVATGLGTSPWGSGQWLEKPCGRQLTQALPVRMGSARPSGQQPSRLFTVWTPPAWPRNRAPARPVGTVRRFAHSPDGAHGSFTRDPPRDPTALRGGAVRQTEVFPGRKDPAAATAPATGAQGRRDEPPESHPEREKANPASHMLGPLSYRQGAVTEDGWGGVGGVGSWGAGGPDPGGPCG